MSADLRSMLPVALLLAVGCGQKPPEAVQAVEKPAAKAEEKGPSTEVVLDAAAMAASRVTVEAVTRRSLPETVRATGRIALNENRTWRVGAMTDGRAVQVLVNVGDIVKQGQVLARLHSHEVHEGRASYQKARSELARWKALESHSRRTRDRLKKLIELKAAAVEQLDHAENELRGAEEGIKQA